MDGGETLFADGELAEQPEKLVTDALAAYNEVAKRQGWGTAEVLTKARRAAIKRAVQDYGGLHGWKRALEIAAKSNFINGKVRPKDDRKQFRATLDWFCRPATVPKILEGFYGDDSVPVVPDIKPVVDIHADDRTRLRNYRPGSFWPASWGERPERPGCRIAPPVLAEWRQQHGITVQAITPVRETPEQRLRAMIASYRKIGKWAKANELERELAGLTKLPPVEVEAPPERPAKAPARGPVTDVTPDYDGIPEMEDWGSE